MPHFLRFPIAAVWIFHGLYSKLLGGIPRHEMIVGRVLGETHARWGITAVGLLEIALGLWILTGRNRITCAAIQTAAIVAMNTIEILLARDLLISAPGMIALNAMFLSLVWWYALQPKASPTGSTRKP